MRTRPERAVNGLAFLLGIIILLIWSFGSCVGIPL